MKKTTWTAALCLLLMISAAAHGQNPTAQGPPPLSAAGQKALGLLDQGDLPGAIAALEPLREQGGLSQMEQAMLGALYIETGRPGDAAEVLAPLADREDADAAVLYNAGRASLAMGFLPAAETYFERSVALVPVSPAARELGLLWGAKGRTFDAYRLMRPWALRHPDDQEVRIAAAACALRLDRESEAAELVAGLPTDNPKVAMLRGQVLLLEGKPDEALTFLTPLLATAPLEMRPDLLRVIADTYVMTGRSEKAVALLPDGAGNDVRLALTLSTAYYRQGDMDKALATLEPYAVNLPGRVEGGTPTGPFAPQVAFEYGRLLVSAGRGADAVPFLETSTALSPGHAPAWKSLGDALLGAGRRDEALEARKKFRDLSAKENDRRRQLQGQKSVKDATTRSILRAQEALDDGDSQRALDILRQEMQISPQDIRLFFSEVAMLLKLDRKEEALERAGATLARFPDHPDAVYQHGAVNLAGGQTAAAEAALRRTLEMAPQHTAAMNDLAVILIARGDDEEARRLLRRVLEVRPEDELARQNLERLDAGG